MTQPSAPVRVGVPDPALRATVVARTPLRYAEGADRALDRPDHVRAGSSLARVPGGLAIVQDDANFVALLAPDGRVHAVTLPAGDGERRQFDDGRGNKRFKLDLEASFSALVGGESWLVAFGSRSMRARETVAIVRGWERGAPSPTLVHVPALYTALRATAAFAGGELNVEGALLDGDRVRLFNRGNGAARDGRLPADATCDLAWPALLAHLASPAAVPPPEPHDVVTYDLGTIDGVRLTFTDAIAWRDRVLFLAAAERSADATVDGPVAGAAVGVIDRDGRTRWAPLHSADGQRFPGKPEGLAIADDGTLTLVLDVDDPERPAELCAVVLAGEWEPGRGRRDAGRGTREAGGGTRDAGCGTRDAGRD
jgi:hypothetical protein